MHDYRHRQKEATKPLISTTPLTQANKGNITAYQFNTLDSQTEVTQCQSFQDFRHKQIEGTKLSINSRLQIQASRGNKSVHQFKTLDTGKQR